MLLAKQIEMLSLELRDEAARRPYVRTLVPQVADDALFWTLVFEMVEIVVHRHDYVLVERSRVKGEPDPPVLRAAIRGEHRKAGSEPVPD